MSILIDKVRISGFRALRNIEVDLDSTTVLTGMNNSGKTSFLKALQIVLGNRQFITQDDFHISANKTVEKIIIDALIVPVNSNMKSIEEFESQWEILFTTDRIRTDGINYFVPLRTIVTYDKIKNRYRSEQFILQNWPAFNENGNYWYKSENGNSTNFHFEELPFYYIDAQRDILEDTKLRNSYLGRMLSKIEYSDEDLEKIESQIKAINEDAVKSSDILLKLKQTLKELDSAMESDSSAVEITPFTKKLRDLSKGLTIYYGDSQDSFPMQYHGMGTRSWSSLLTLKSFISLLSTNAEDEKTVFFPITAIEEPEAHIHPNAQKKLYSQISSIKGQKIISTHSPYIAATAKLDQVRNFYRDTDVSCGRVLIKSAEMKREDIRKIERQVINTRGEIFFSKIIVFVEGETEEQALPILAEEYFELNPVEIGIDFVGVGGGGNFLPFLRFAENLNIPWLILSDAEAEAIKSVNKQVKKLNSLKNIQNLVVFLDQNNNFEKQLINDGFQSEIKSAIESFDKYENAKHKKAKEKARKKEIEGYDDDKLYKIIKSDKTKYSPVIAELIVKSGKNLPPKITELFERLKERYNIGEGEQKKYE